MATLELLLKTNKENLASFERELGHFFQDRFLLQIAFIHSSYSFEQGQDCPENNERLEFLGDAVLDLVIGYLLYQCYPEVKEGELSRFRAALVKESHLAVMAREIDLGNYLFLGKGEEASLGREKPSILSCALEAVIGAVFVDGGYEAAFSVVNSLFAPWISRNKELMLSLDAKSGLQELLQERYSEPPYYTLDWQEGPDHAKVFHVSVRFRGKVLGQGSSTSKKEAEQLAAATAIREFKNLDKQ
ncbi:MAG: ribonuclease III [Desulfobia sp.]